mmetsp:Transcript_77856/g.202859  ORF Transcript_77856/g.202859 Transcript_77856/m.202859 type:complete len:214 (+) Transcript_77856:1091-1732(+)
MQDAVLLQAPVLLQYIHPGAVLRLQQLVLVEAALQETPVKPGVEPALAVHGALVPRAFVGAPVRPDEPPMAVQLAVGEGALIRAAIAPLDGAGARQDVVLPPAVVRGQHHRLVRKLLAELGPDAHRRHRRVHELAEAVPHEGAVALLEAGLALPVVQLAPCAEAELQDLWLGGLLFVLRPGGLVRDRVVLALLAHGCRGRPPARWRAPTRGGA